MHNYSWIATQGLAKEAVYARMRLTPSSERSDQKIRRAAGRELENGLTLVVLARVEHPLLKEAELGRFSIGCTLVACNVSDIVMFSSAEQWTNGSRQWRVQHSGDHSVNDLKVFGTAPENLASIEDEYRVRQANEPRDDKHQVDHVFEIPLVLAKSITTFRHDETDLEGFELLEWQSSIKPWWRIW